MNTILNYKYLTILISLLFASCQSNYSVSKGGGTIKGLRFHNVEHELFILNDDPEYSLEKIVQISRKYGFQKEEFYGVGRLGGNLIPTKYDFEYYIMIDTIDNDKISLCFYSLKNLPPKVNKKQFIELADSVYNLIGKQYIK